jgi:ABC-type multidrug transport system ATPase subunit
MTPKLWSEKIEFSDGSIVTCGKNEIIVFVGPNNAGKSATLKEASNLLSSKNLKGKVIRSISFGKEGTISDLTRFIESISIKEITANSEPWYKGLDYRVYGGF